MSDTAPQLPTDIATLQALLAQARAERDAAVAERDHLQSQNDRLRHLLRQLQQRAQFGRSSEKFDPDRATDQGRAADRGDGGLCCGRQIHLAPAALPAKPRC